MSKNTRRLCHPVTSPLLHHLMIKGRITKGEKTVFGRISIRTQSGVRKEKKVERWGYESKGRKLEERGNKKAEERRKENRGVGKEEEGRKRKVRRGKARKKRYEKQKEAAKR